RGGWICFHHASLLGEFDGYSMWQWFSKFMGGIRYVNYIAGFAEANVRIELRNHPVMKGVPASFVIKKDEWYIYNKRPRSNVQVIATVDESSYTPASTITMGDHPVIWSNTNYIARNIYIFMGHSPDLFDNKVYTTIFQNAIFWTASK
ncbi:MAG: ThuA domain-containing protein, partial [Chitinophagaceae bacterium]